MTSQLSTDEGHDPELIKLVDEEDTKQDLAEVPATPEGETTITGTANTAIFAKSRATDRKSAERE